MTSFQRASRKRTVVAAVVAFVSASVLGIGCSGDGPTGAGTPAAAVSITAAPDDGVLLVGTSFALEALASNPSGGRVSRSISWTSSNQGVATVSASGGLNGVSAGPALIIARADAVADTILVSVRVPIPMTPAGAAAAATTSVLGGAVSLTIPPGAGAAAQLTVAPAAVLPDDDRILGAAAFDFGPSGATFSSPITMSLRYTAASVPAAKRPRLRIVRVESDGLLTLIPGGVVDEGNSRVSAPVSSFSTYAVMVPADVATIAPLEGNSQPGFVGTEIDGQSVILRDAQGRGVPLVTVNFSVATGGGSLVGESTSVTDANGVAALPGGWLLGPAKGTQMLRATIVGDGRFATFTANVTAPATTLSIDPGAPAAAISGVTLPQPIVVRVADAFGDPVTEIGRTVTARIVSGTGVLQGDSIVDAPTGIAIFQNLRIAGSGAHRIAFVSGSLTPDTTATITVTQQLAQLVVIRQPAGAQSGLPFATQPLIELRDNAGLPMASGSETVVASAVHGPGVPFGGLTATAVSGVATFSGLAIEGAGTQRLRFSSGFVDVISDEFVVAPAPEGVYLRVGLVPAITLTRAQGYGVDLFVDLSNRGAADLRLLEVRVEWDPARLEYEGATPIGWTDINGASSVTTVDQSQLGLARVIVTGETPAATITSFILQRLQFRPRGDAPLGPTNLNVLVLATSTSGGTSVPISVRNLQVTVVQP